MAFRKRKASTGTGVRKPAGFKRSSSKRRKTLSDGSTPERVIQAQILSWLENETTYLHWRQNSGKIPVHGRLINLGPDGISDIVLVLPPTGRLVGLEVKSANGVLRPVQKAFRDRLEAAGGIYRVVRSLQEVKEVLWELASPQSKQMELEANEHRSAVQQSVELLNSKLS